MGIDTRRKREVEELKSKILSAATKLFKDKGYENVSMRKIAQKIEYSPTTIYIYFKNKQDILFHLLQDGYAIFLDYLQRAANSTDVQDSDRLRQTCKAYVYFGLDYPDYYELIFNRNLQLEGELRENSDRYKGFQLLVALVEECIKAGVLKEEQAILISQSIWASLHGITALLIAFPSFPWEDKDELIKLHIETMLRGWKK